MSERLLPEVIIDSSVLSDEEFNGILDEIVRTRVFSKRDNRLLIIPNSFEELARSPFAKPVEMGT